MATTKKQRTTEQPLMQLVQISAWRKPRYSVSINEIIIKGDWDIQVNYEIHPENEERKLVKFFCTERPRNEFVKSFEELKPNIKSICGLDNKIWETGRIASIAFKDQENGTKLAIALRTVSEQSIVTAVVKDLYPIGEFLEKIGNLIAEVEDYIDGVRQVQQMTINDFLPKDAAPVAVEEEEEVLEL